MTEAEWLACRDPELMQDYLRRTNGASPRKLHLFGCACCRRVEHLLADDSNRRAIAVAERSADGLVDNDERQTARDAATAGVNAARGALEDAGAALGLSRGLVTAFPAGTHGGTWLAACATLHNSSRHPAWKAALHAARSSAEASAWLAAGREWIEAWRIQGNGRDAAPSNAPWNAVRKAARTQEETEQATLLRHIVGNPFRSHPASGPWTCTVTHLAEALYAGEDCAFALHDALLEAGHAGLAEHFRQETWHPKGCWVLDLILGKN